MIQFMSHTPIFVLDQDAALDFYTNKLGFELKTDAKMDNGFRWITVSPPGQPELEITLMSVEPGMNFDEEASGHLKWLVSHGKLGAGVFSTADCRKTYAELKAKGVEFVSEPKDEFYGTEAIFKDASGNWFSLSQPKK